MSLNPSAGDVMVVYDSTIGAWFIRLGAFIRFKPYKWNHVLIFSHYDAAGEPWAIEAHPGRVSWTAGKDLKRYLASHKTLSNIAQPKSPNQRRDLVRLAKAMFGTQYDWEGIVEDGMLAIGAPELLLSKDFGPDKPLHVVCSSFIKWLYDRVGLGSPHTPTRTCTPADWAEYILDMWGPA
jgi:hypothetical protein